VSGIVLAGGMSARMGRDKALLPFGSTTLLAHVVEIVRTVTAPVIVVAGVADQYALPGRVRVIGDLYPNAGPLGGIVTGLKAVDAGYHLITACDMPFLRPELLHRLLKEAEGYDGAVPEVNGRPEPLCAVYHSRCAERLRASLESGERAVHRALQSLSIRHVEEDRLRQADPDLVSFTNLNTPEEYRVSDEW